MDDRERRWIRSLIRGVDAVLWEVWDPIGVNVAPETRDEYSSYAPAVARLLVDGAPDAAIEAHLSDLVEGLGISWVDRERMARTLSALRALVEEG